jgi:hypothetical protein
MMSVSMVAILCFPQEISARYNSTGFTQPALQNNPESSQTLTSSAEVGRELNILVS